jgi:hypothetical protein
MMWNLPLNPGRQRMKSDIFFCTQLHPPCTLPLKKDLSAMLKSLLVVVRLEGFGPPTCGLEVRCSIQLSYRRNTFLVPSTFC